MEIHQIDEINFNGYAYRGEGNAHLVVALPATKSVLRFRKVNSKEELSNDNGRERVEFEYLFFKQITSNYLGKFVKQPKIIQCHPRDFINWDRIVDSYRPDNRKHKNLFENYAVELPDYTLLPNHLDKNLNGEKEAEETPPVFCIEIKPKQGFVCEAEQNIHKCPYCILQFHKLKSKKIRRRSSYCPCNLFSKDKSRICRAIIAMIESPQNNFIVFKNGFRAWGEGYDRKDLEQLLKEWFSNDNSYTNEQLYQNLIYLITEALVREFTPQDKQQNLSSSLIFNQIDKNELNLSDGNHLDLDIISKANDIFQQLDEKCDYSDGDLPKGSVLDRIYQMQRLNDISFDKVYSIYSSECKSLNDKMVYLFNSNDDRYKIENKNSLLYKKLCILQNYLLFSIARDCSILLSFREIKPKSCVQSIITDNHVIWLPTEDRCFLFNIGITDVDSKKLDCIVKHQQRNILSLNSVTTIDSNE